MRKIEAQLIGIDGGALLGDVGAKRLAQHSVKDVRTRVICGNPEPTILIYLGLNLAFGTLGHVGVEPYPAAWFRWPVLRDLGSSTFHAGHHQDLAVNFGFYTTLWDRLFGTLGAGGSALLRPRHRG